MTRMFALLAGLALTTTIGVAAGGRSPDVDPDEFGPWSGPVNLGPIVNSAVTDAGPRISRDGLSLYFHSARGNVPSNPDLYVSRRAAIDLPWEAPVSVASLNSDVADAGPTLSRNGRLLLFGTFRTGSFDIFVSRRRTPQADAWETPEPLPAPINGPGFDVPADLVDGPGGPQLYFASDRANGLGAPGLDLYVADVRRDGTWSEPVYLSDLNSPSQDDRPAIRSDGLELVFGSAREGGQMDLYVSRRRHVSDPWSTPENLGPTVNSLAGDIHPALSANGRTLYFASARSGQFDLYACTRAKVR